MMTAIVAAGIAAFILIYFASNVNEKEHFILRLLLFSFGIVLLIFLGKGAIDGQEICEIETHNHHFTYFQGSETFSGLTIGAHHPNQVLLNDALTFYLTVYDENGKRKDNSSVSCEHGVTDAQGDIIYINNSVMYGSLDDVWQGNIPENTLNHTGLWTFQLFCNDANNGGFFNGEIEVTDDGDIEHHIICEETPRTTGTVLYKTILYMFIVYVAYILFYFVYWMFNMTKKFWKRR